ncbi:hypothetical protein B0H34DRAFT_693568 [Crassisporium funariophilum]|nr:hypothetical protein B0H34DRAFT_693568 [Crassisporium funariophilum]
MFTKTLGLFLLPALAAAQYGYAPPANSGPTTTAAAAVTVPSAPADSPGNMNIDVAFQSTFTFHPSNITAPVGTLVTFWFPSAGISHSVTQSSFASPCTYLAASSNSSGGFDSGLQQASKFTINITDTNPIWFHCKQLTHCGTLGMVGSINAPSTGNTFDAFKSNAMALGSAAPTETDNGPVTGGVNGVAVAAPTTDTGSGGSGSSSSPSGATAVAASTGFALLSLVFVTLMV